MTPLDVRYWGMTALLAETSRAYAAMSAAAEEVPDDDLMDRIRRALSDAARDSETAEISGSLRSGWGIFRPLAEEGAGR